MPDLSAPVINEHADHALGKIIIRYGLVTLLLLTVMTVVMTFVNVFYPGPIHRFFDTLGLLIVMFPFFLGINKLFAARLILGRELVAARNWPQAIAALDPFAGTSQRFLDKTGEAHYLLSIAYQSHGDTQKAEAARVFVRKYRPGPWQSRLAQTPHSIKENARPRRNTSQDDDISSRTSPNFAQKHPWKSPSVTPPKTIASISFASTTTSAS